MKEITLHDGTVVRVRSVPAYATTQAVMQHPDPEMPTVTIKTIVSDNVETKFASPGSPEWSEYQKQLRAVQLARVSASRALDYDYGVVEWLRPVTAESLPDKEDWTDQPPKGWKFPKALQAHGVKPFGVARIDYIAFELLAHTGDHEAFLNSTGDAVSITDAEVEAALASFPVEVARRIIAKVEGQWDNDG